MKGVCRKYRDGYCDETDEECSINRATQGLCVGFEYDEEKIICELCGQDILICKC